MPSLRLFPVVLGFALVACSNSDSDTPAELAPHYTYVASELEVPTNNSQAREFGLDLNGDGNVDNQLGQVLGTLAGQGIDVQIAMERAVRKGNALVLFDFQTQSFSSASQASLTVLAGDKSTTSPAPCAGPTDTVCGKHLVGTGTFTVAANQEETTALEGAVADATFNGGPGAYSLPFTLDDSGVISLNLIGARARATGLSEDGMDSIILGGALDAETVDALYPLITEQIGQQIARDCSGGSPPQCGCEPGSTGGTLRVLFDTGPVDCTVSVTEVRGNFLIASLMAPDVEIDGRPALSVGFKATAVKATFPTTP